MRTSFNNREEDQLRTRYRMLLRDAEKLSDVNPEMSNNYFSEAEKILNKLTMLRNRNRSIVTRNYSHFA